MSTIDINNYTIDAIIINMNYKLLDLENMEENLNNLYFSEKIEETIEEKNEKQLQQQQDFNDIKHLGSAIGHYIETKRTNDDNTIQDIYKKLISKSNIKITQLDSRGSNDSVMSTVIGNLKQTRTDMIEIVTNIYKNSVNKENAERLLYYLMYIKIILEKIRFFRISLSNSKLGDDTGDTNEEIIKIDNIIEKWDELINKTKESLDHDSKNIWKPIYNKITDYIKDTIYQHTETIKKYDNKEKYREITTKWANSIITENNEYKRRMLIDIVTQNITRSTKKSL